MMMKRIPINWTLRAKHGSRDCCCQSVSGGNPPWQAVRFSTPTVEESTKYFVSETCSTKLQQQTHDLPFLSLRRARHE
jgi:hypothetical protein